MMRHLKASAFVAILATAACLTTTTTAQAQQRGRTPNVGQLVSGLLNVQVNVGDITVDDLIDVENVLNDNEIRILNNILNRSPILSNNQDVLNNLLRDAEIITVDETVVGILNGFLVIAPIDIL